MAEGSSTPFPREAIKHVLRAARDAGYSPEESRALVRNPEAKFVEDGLNPKLLRQLTPNTIAHLFARLDGNETASRALVSLGSTLFEMQNFYERNSGRVIEAKEQKILGIGVKLLEDALYRGSLARMNGKSAAELAFLANRLAKIMSLPRHQQEVVGFDEARFRAFADSVKTFGDAYLSDERFETELATAHARRMECETALESDPEGFAYARVSIEIEKAESEIRLERARVMDVNYLKLAIEDMRQRLEKALRIFYTIYGKATDADGKRNEDLLEDLLITLSDPETVERAAERIQFVKDEDCSMTSLTATKYTDTYGQDFALEHYLRPNLMSLKDSKVPPKKRLSNQMYAKQITNDVLTVASEIVGTTGPLSVLKKLLLKRNTLKLKGSELFDPIRRRKDEKNKAIYAWMNAFNEEERLLKAQRDGRLQARRLALARSADTILRDFPSRMSAGPYFVKTMLVAADMRRRSSDKDYLGYRIVNIVPGTNTWSFNEPDYSKLRYTVDKGESTPTNFADVHFIADHLPFAEMAVLMQEGSS